MEAKIDFTTHNLILNVVVDGVSYDLFVPPVSKTEIEKDANLDILMELFERFNNREQSFAVFFKDYKRVVKSQIRSHLKSGDITEKDLHAFYSMFESSLISSYIYVDGSPVLYETSPLKSDRIDNQVRAFLIFFTVWFRYYGDIWTDKMLRETMLNFGCTSTSLDVTDTSSFLQKFSLEREQHFKEQLEQSQGK